VTIPASREIRIPLGRLTLAAKAWGDPDDPPMLALHGWLDNAGSFDRLAPLLEGRHIIALDLAGHGRSDHRASGNWYPYVDFLDELREVQDFFGWSSIDLLGHSLGATLASVYAAAFPDKVGRLLLIEGLGPLSIAVDKTLEQMRRSLLARASFTGAGLRLFADLDEAIEARQRAGMLSREAARCIVERGVLAVEDPHDPRIERSTAIDDARTDTASAHDGGGAPARLSWSSDPQLTLPSPSRLTEEQIGSILSGIAAATLLVLAEPEAPYLPRTVMQARIARVKGIEVVRLSGTHHLHLEDAPAVAAAMRSFLGRRP